MKDLEPIFKDLQEGKAVILMDEHREGEGDLMVAAEKTTVKHIAFMLNQARGFVCLAIRESRRIALGIPWMVQKNTEASQPPFCGNVSVKNGGSGTSAKDRVAAIRLLLDPKTQPEDIAQPGHLNVLSATENGLIDRFGQTEGSCDLAQLAGLTPAAIICEIMNPDGSMSDLSQIRTFSRKWGLRMVTVEDVLAYRRYHEALVKKTASSQLPTAFGPFQIQTFSVPKEKNETVVLVQGKPDGKPPLVRIHSECLTGEVFHSRRCDCKAQLTEAMRRIQREPFGILVYLRQEGRGIGLENKIKAYALQDKGLDTVEANEELGFAADLRDYWVADQVLKALNSKKVRLLTNNPQKVRHLKEYGIDVIERIPLKLPKNPYNAEYLSVKKTKMGHLL